MFTICLNYTYTCYIDVRKTNMTVEEGEEADDV